jgi:hypothetical protein
MYAFKNLTAETAEIAEMNYLKIKDSLWPSRFAFMVKLGYP